MDKEDLKVILTNETFCVNNTELSMWIKVCPVALSHVRKIDATTVAILCGCLATACVIAAILVYLFNDRLKKKYIVLANKWKIPVATYVQVSYRKKTVGSEHQMTLSQK
jgi:ABC-type transporter Mla MlaB component